MDTEYWKKFYNNNNNNHNKIISNCSNFCLYIIKYFTENNNIPYFALGGTLIGCIRDGGDFLGNKYLCPNVDYLEYLYGKDWNIPKKEKFTTF